MPTGDIRLSVVFFRTGSGTEPVRRWLKSLAATHKKVIGEDIKTVQFGWPLGMPLVEKRELDTARTRLRQYQARPASPKQPRVLTCPGRALPTEYRTSV
jgi:hypothetical protein